MTTNKQRLTDAALEATLARYAARVSAEGLQAGIMAEVAATKQVREPLVVLPGWLARPAAPGRLVAIPTVAWVLLLAGLLLALVGGLAAGAFGRHPAIVTPITSSTLLPAEIEVLPPGPIAYTRLVATSSDELWAISGRAVWHFRDGDWTPDETDAGRVVGPNYNVTLAPDGTVWAAGADGVAYRRDGRWVKVHAQAVSEILPGPGSAIAVGRDGTVWLAGAAGGCHVWRLQASGRLWTGAEVPDCPREIGAGGAVTSVAVDGRGAVWIGAHGFVNDALARYADGRWETTEARAGLPKFQSAEVLGISATGDVWVSLRTAGSNYTARYDGTTWSVMPAPGVAAWSAVAPDEALWASAIGRYDWKNWVGLPAEVVLPLAPLVVAPDRTVFAIDADGRIVRLPALSPAP